MTDGYARCNFDGRPMSPGDAAVVRNFAEFLSVRKTEPGLHWCELSDDDDARGPYWVYWFCEPPDSRSRWRAERAEWSGQREGLPVRRIYAVRTADAAEESPPGTA